MLSRRLPRQLFIGTADNDGLNPANAPQNGGNFTLTVQGTGFTLASKILFNGITTRDYKFPG